MSYAITKEKFLNPSELKYFYKIISKATPFNRLLIKMLLHTGARAQEILNIQANDLDLENKTVMIRGLKKSNDRELPLPPQLFAKLLEQSRVEPTRPVFDISYIRLYQIWNEHCPTRGKGPHAARHTVGINLYKKHNNLNLVKLVLGHKSITNTIIYSEYVFKTSELRKLVCGKTDKPEEEEAAYVY